jgi:uncharacterized protein
MKKNTVLSAYSFPIAPYAPKEMEDEQMKSVIVYRHTTFFRIMKLAVTLDDLRKGLLGKTTAGSGLFLMGANRIHTFGMKIPIDVVYLNPFGLVIGIEEHLMPNREGIAFEGTRHVVELNAGAIRRHQITVGEQWHWQ